MELHKKNIIPVNTKIISSTKHIELENTLFHRTNIQKTLIQLRKIKIISTTKHIDFHAKRSLTQPKNALKLENKIIYIYIKI